MNFDEECTNIKKWRTWGLYGYGYHSTSDYKLTLSNQSKHKRNGRRTTKKYADNRQKHRRNRGRK